MTVRLSNLQINVMRLFQAQQGVLHMEEFIQINQGITSSLGRRKIPLLVRVPGDRFALTAAGKEAARLIDESDVFRKVARTTIAHVFDHATRMRIVTRQSGSKPKRKVQRNSAVA